MNDFQIKSEGNTYICDECKNENEIGVDKNVMDAIECAYCGIEYRIEDLDEEGNYTLEILEEEK